MFLTTVMVSDVCYATHFRCLMNIIGSGNSEQAFRMHIVEDGDGLHIGIMALTQREFGIHDEISTHK